jgi:RNA polymerase sigma-70 factor (ECF subfamily)
LFAAALTKGGAGDSSATAGPTLEAALERARAAWPGVRVTDADFVRFLAERVADEPDPVAAVRSLAHADLYLACACATSDPVALREFDRVYLSQVHAYLARDRAQGLADEVSQTLREQLFVGSRSRAPKILSYGGRGPLGAWLRITAVRTAQNLRAKRKDHVPLEASPADRERSPNLDPEMAYLKGHYAREFRAAFESTLEQLSADERNVLRLYFLDGLTLAAIARLYRVHESTVLRWIARARKSIQAETRRILGERLRARLAPSEFESLVGLVHSQVDVSIRRFLKKSTT